MVLLHAGQLRGQWCAFGLPGSVWLGRLGESFELFLNGGDVGINAIVDQTGLSGIELLAALAELGSSELSNLIGEFVDLGLAVGDLPITLGNLLVAAGDSCDQSSGQRAQLLRVQFLDLLCIDHWHAVCRPAVELAIGSYPDCIMSAP